MDLVLGDLLTVYIAQLCFVSKKKGLLSRSVDREHDWAANKLGSRFGPLGMPDC